MTDTAAFITVSLCFFLPRLRNLAFCGTLPESRGHDDQGRSFSCNVQNRGSAFIQQRITSQRSEILVFFWCLEEVIPYDSKNNDFIWADWSLTMSARSFDALLVFLGDNVLVFLSFPSHLYK